MNDKNSYFWEIKEEPVKGRFDDTFVMPRDIDSEDILSYYDGVLEFLFTDSDGTRMHARIVSDMEVNGEMVDRWTVVPTTDQIIENMENGVISYLKAITRENIWVVDIRHKDGKPANCWLQNFEDIPSSIWPEEDFYLK